jgi:hypothetical protein
MLGRLSGAMEQQPNLSDDRGFFTGSMGWMHVEALMQLETAMNKTFDLSNPQVKYSSNTYGEWPHALKQATGWTEFSKKSPYFQHH